MIILATRSAEAKGRRAPGDELPCGPGAGRSRRAAGRATEPIMAKQPAAPAGRDGGPVPGAAPAFFVILKPPRGPGQADQGILVANGEAGGGGVAPARSRARTCLPAHCSAGAITVTLDNNSMWNEFYHRSTEMILTKQGRRMFPYCRYWLTGLDADLKYILVMDISPVDNHRYKWNGRRWEPSGKAEPHVLGRVFIHPESPSTGQYWMHQPVSFYKLKLTNNTLDQEGHIILHSMHRYLPRLHLVPADKATEVIQLNGPDVRTFTFPQTEFFAVTAYQNIQITQLKIDYNPFAKGFRDDGLNGRPQRDGRPKAGPDQDGGGGAPGAAPPARGPADGRPDGSSFDAERDFLGFLEAGLPLGGMPELKREISASPVASSFGGSSRAASPSDANRPFNVVIKEEPPDEYDYQAGRCPEGVTVKQEETDEETDVYSSDDGRGPGRQPGRPWEAAGSRGSRRPPRSPPGAAKAKMLKLDSGKMPVVCLEPCAITKSTVKISELPRNMLSPSRKDRSPDHLPGYPENARKAGPGPAAAAERADSRKQFTGSKGSPKRPSGKEPPWQYPGAPNPANAAAGLGPGLQPSAGDPFPKKEGSGRKKTLLKIAGTQKTCGPPGPPPAGPGRRGRPRKLKPSKPGRPPKNAGKPAIGKNDLLGPGLAFPTVKPDLEDVDGVLFISFASKEALDIHTLDRASGEDPSALQALASPTNGPDCRARISQLEKELLEDLKALRHKQVIHPGLQEVGLKLNSVDPTVSIDLKYLGVQLPLAPATSLPLWSLSGANLGASDSGFPFVSRTGKTNDFTKIKGWRRKFHSASASRNEGGSSEGSLKNRSAFCSDKLDEYLENEGKLMESSLGLSSTSPTPPVVYQLPTKSTSYVRTLDSVLKKQSSAAPSTSHSSKPHPAPAAASRKPKAHGRQSGPGGRAKATPYKPILPSPRPRHVPAVPGEKASKAAAAAAALDGPGESFVVPALEDSVLPKPAGPPPFPPSLPPPPPPHQAARPPGLSKSQVKLMDLEDCALWEGKPRTYITEERADVSLATLLTAQASLKTKPIHKIIRKRAPPCNNDFCRLGCVCASLALEKRQPAHCRRPDCMFGCTCLKRKVMLVRAGSKPRRVLRKALHRHLGLGGPPAEEQPRGDGNREEERLRERRKRKKMEYAICDPEPELPVRHYPLWVKVEGEVDPEPVYIPTPSVVEPTKAPGLPHAESSLAAKTKPPTGAKPARAYAPKPNPVIREEDKDPVYLYFESMMTCARVRVYERKGEEDGQSPLSTPPPPPQRSPGGSDSTNGREKECDSEHQPPKPSDADTEKDSEKSEEPSWRTPRPEGDPSPSTSYVHRPSPAGPTKLIEIISDCNWEEDRGKILSILSQHLNSNMPQSLKVGSFIIELASQRQGRDDGREPSVYSSRVKISMPPCRDPRGEAGGAPDPDPETPEGAAAPEKAAAADSVTLVRLEAVDRLQEKLPGGKGLPFYSGLSPSGRLVAYKRKSGPSPAGLIQVASNAKAAASRTPPAQVPSPAAPQATPPPSSASPASSMMTLKAFFPAQRPPATRPSPGGVFTQFVMSKVGTLRQKIPGVRVPQPLPGPPKFSFRQPPLAAAAPGAPPGRSWGVILGPAVTLTTVLQVSVGSVPTGASPAVTASTGAKETTGSPPESAAAPGAGLPAKGLGSPTPPSPSVATVTSASRVPGKAAPPAPSDSIFAPPAAWLPVASKVGAASAAPSSAVTPPASLLGSIPLVLSGIGATLPGSQSPPDETPSGPGPAPRAPPGPEKRMGPRLLLIPMQQGSPPLRPLQAVQQVAQGQRMVLQPLRSPSGGNLFRHPSGQIIQLVPLQQLRASGTQPSLQPVVLRNPGSLMGIRLPAPAKPDAPASLPASPGTTNPLGQAMSPPPATKLMTQALTVLPSVPSFVSQAGTLTLRISPPGPESRLAGVSGGQPVGPAGLVPLQSGSFALLQLPGQKAVPSSILQHAASLQANRGAGPQVQSSPPKQRGDEKMRQPAEGAGGGAASPGPVGTPRTQEGEETPGSAAPGAARGAAGGCAARKPLSSQDGPADPVGSDHSYISGSRAGEEGKVGARETGAEGAADRPRGDSGAEPKDGRAGPEEVRRRAKPPGSLSRPTSPGGPKERQEASAPTGAGEERMRAKNSAEEREPPGTGRRARSRGAEPAGPPPRRKDREDAAGEGGAGTRPVGSPAPGRVEAPRGESGRPADQPQGPGAPAASRVRSPPPGSRREGGAARGHRNGLTGPAERDGPARGPEPAAEEEEKTDDSADEGLEGASSTYQSDEEEVDVEKLGELLDYSEDEDEEQVDIETVEELSEKINIARLKASVGNAHSSKQPRRSPSPSPPDEKPAVEISIQVGGSVDWSHFCKLVPVPSIRSQNCVLVAFAGPGSLEANLCSSQDPPLGGQPKPQLWNKKLRNEAEAFAHYRRTHTANERRRRNEMRDLFEKLKKALGLHNLPKVSKSYILKQALEEIQGLTDQADKLIGQKNLLTRKRNNLIRKVSTLSGKTEEVVLKKLEYIYAKQKALEAQKKRKQMGQDEPSGSPRAGRQQEGAGAADADTPAAPREPGRAALSNRRGKPLILSRKGGQAADNNLPAPLALTSASLVMTPQGQVLTLKSPLVSGPVTAIPPTLLQAELKPRVTSTAVGQPGLTSMMLQLPGTPVPVQLKGILTDSSGPITLAAIAGGSPAPPAGRAASQPTGESDDLFMMPRIVNVTSLASDVALGLDVGIDRPAGIRAPDRPPKDGRENKDPLAGAGEGGRRAPGPAAHSLDARDPGFPKILPEAPEGSARKGPGGRRKESGGERPKSALHKLQAKELKEARVELELWKMASAMEEEDDDEEEAAAAAAAALAPGAEESDAATAADDETLTSLLHEIAFLNQQLNDDSAALAELPGPLAAAFPPRRGPPRRPLRFGPLGGSAKEPPGARAAGGLSPLLLHLEEEEEEEEEEKGEGRPPEDGEPPAQPARDLVRIVLDAETKKPRPPRLDDGGQGAGSPPAEPDGVSSPPPVLQMKTGTEAGSPEAQVWRPMPKLAPLGLKVSSPPGDADGQGPRVMPLLAPVVAKGTPAGLQAASSDLDQDGQENNAMPTLAPVVASPGSGGASPTASAGP
ncbi:LOW QUALITY PROTEIN: MAX gene-associated protein [Tachyglossus aculeatus]|uniref:LOW QUALITY PROTEIN: MAX gene-associated protein n=1 Tax=Tachyglossus aculeatus TaxID=9261 RepID=UPI0018F4F8A5|nr:LOW QUALITY PROTEIN: MAX gene-associated protein [Tachyglossus aculeatus]